MIDDLSTGSLDNLAGCVSSIELVQDDVAGPSAGEAIADSDLIFHLAARNVRASIKHPGPNFAVNGSGTLAVLEAVRRGRGRFIYISSSEVYGIPRSGHYSEVTLPEPTTVYGAGKLAGELLTLAYHRTYGLDTRVIRPFNNFGPRSHFEGDSGEVIPKFILRALADLPLHVHGDGTQTRDFMYVEDSAHWMVALALSDSFRNDVVNIGSGAETSVGDLARLIVKETGSSSPIVSTTARPGDLPRLVADTTKVRSAFEFDLPTDFLGGLRQTVEYFSRQDVDKLLAQEIAHNWQ